VSDAGATYLGYAVVRVAHALGKEMERRLAPLALTPTGFSALFQLARSPGLSAAALARAILVTPQSVGPLFEGLAVAGLVAREPGGPRGAIRTTLTALGEERLAAADRAVRGLDEDLVAQLPGVDHPRLAGLLHRAADRPFPSS
jgi:DNA-binding MarR family transcriptional regulator